MLFPEFSLCHSTQFCLSDCVKFRPVVPRGAGEEQGAVNSLPVQKYPEVWYSSPIYLLLFPEASTRCFMHSTRFYGFIKWVGQGKVCLLCLTQNQTLNFLLKESTCNIATIPVTFLIQDYSHTKMQFESYYYLAKK